MRMEQLSKYVKVGITILIFLILVTFVTLFNSTFSFPRKGVSNSVEVTTRGYIGFIELVFLYRGDRYSFKAVLPHNISNVSIYIRGILTGENFKWSGGLNTSSRNLPVFIPRLNDWYLIKIEFNISKPIEFVNIQYDTSSYEVPRYNIADFSTSLIPFLAIGIFIIYILIILLESRSTFLKLIIWELSSLYKWILFLTSIVVFIDLYEGFNTVYAVSEVIYPMAKEAFNMTPYSLLEGIYNGVNFDRLVNILLILSIIVNLMNVSYYLDRKFQRVYITLGMDFKRIYFTKWFTGYLIVAASYILAKTYVDSMVFQPLPTLFNAYSNTIIQRILFDLYLTFYYYTIIFSIAISSRNISTSVPLLMTTLILRIWLMEHPIINHLFNFPIYIRDLLLQGCIDLIGCLDGYNLILFLLPFIMLVISYLINSVRDID